MAAAAETYRVSDVKTLEKLLSEDDWQERADSIKNILIRSGFDASRIISIGRGESEPIADNETDEGRALNRRVEFLVEKIREVTDSEIN